MNYCIVNADGIIENIIVCESDEVAAQFGAVASYDGAAIGEAYSPPPPPPIPPLPPGCISLSLPHEDSHRLYPPSPPLGAPP